MKTLLFSYCLLLLISTSSIQAGTTINSQAPVFDSEPFIMQHMPAGGLPEGLSASDWSSIQAQITARQYRAQPQADGGYAADNPAHGWGIRHAADGTTTLQPRDPEAPTYQLGFRLKAVGFVVPQPLGRPQRVSTDGVTVTYQWTADLREWWTNSEGGLEQWFELERRPAGAIADQPLQLQLALYGELIPRLSGDSLAFAGEGETAITYSKLKAWDATGRELPARMLLAANTLSLQIEDSDARYPLTIDPTLEQQAYLEGSNTGAGANFGIAVALDGDTLAVGAYGDNAVKGGAAYVFVRSGTAWTEQAYLTASNAAYLDQFGSSVALEADTLVVGARYEKYEGTTTNRSGAVYVFTRSGTAWTERAYFKGFNYGAGDLFGNSVALSGDTLVVGAPGEASSETGAHAPGQGNEADNSAPTAGAAYVFTGSGATWTPQAYLKASNTDLGDLFGTSVAIDVDTIVVGANREGSPETNAHAWEDGNQANDISFARAGAAYVYTRSGTTWSGEAFLKAFNTDGDDQFGYSVAVDGDTVVVGALLEDSSETGAHAPGTGNEASDSSPNSGAAYVYTRSGTTWSPQAYVKASNTASGDQFGASVALENGTLVVGANSQNSVYTDSGAAYVYTLGGDGLWSPPTYLKASNAAASDFFGSAVAVSGDTLAVGAYAKDRDSSTPNSGAAYVFAPPRRVIVITQ